MVGRSLFNKNRIASFVELLAFDHHRIAGFVDDLHDVHDRLAVFVELRNLLHDNVAVSISFRFVNDVAVLVQFGHTEGNKEFSLFLLSFSRRKALTGLTHDDVNRVVVAETRQREVECHCADEGQQVPERLLQDIT